MGINEDRIGEISYNNQGLKMEIIEYHNHKNVKIRFEDGEEAIVQYGHFKRGSVKSKKNKNIFGVGNSNGVDEQVFKLPSYDCWYRMMRRCYDEKLHKRQPKYIGCKVDEVWHDFINFKKWYDENYYEINEDRTELDKDILNKGNNTYSPDNCIFVPKFINTMFTKANNRRGDLPIGVSRKNGKYCSYIRINNKLNHLGMYSDPLEAFEVYKKTKEGHIKQVADKYKDQIPQKLYDAMYNYKVEITD